MTPKIPRDIQDILRSPSYIAMELGWIKNRNLQIDAERATEEMAIRPADETEQLGAVATSTEVAPIQDL